MNILIVGTGIAEQNLIMLCKKSKHLDYIYTASSEPLDDIPNIEYENYDDLTKKAKALQIDLTISADKQHVQNGIVEIFNKNLLNIISVNKKWLNLETSRLAAKQLLDYYSINNPKAIRAPMFFPVVIKTDKPRITKIAKSMQELVEIREELAGKKVFLEEFMNGEIFCILSLWDGKNLIFFDKNLHLTEVQKERLDLYKTKLNFMLSDEKADFIGFFSSKLMWAKNDWYVLEYIMNLNKNTDFNSITQDFLYILNLAIYQNLNEISY